jgi:hypothetical protein
VLSHLQAFLGLPMNLGGQRASEANKRMIDSTDAVRAADRGLPANTTRRAMLEAAHVNSYAKHLSGKTSQREKSSFGQHARTALDEFYKPHIRELGALLLRRARSHSEGGMLVLPTDVVPAHGDTPESVAHALLA